MHKPFFLLVLKNIICPFYLTALNANEQKSVEVKSINGKCGNFSVFQEMKYDIHLAGTHLYSWVSIEFSNHEAMQWRHTFLQKKVSIIYCNLWHIDKKNELDRNSRENHIHVHVFHIYTAFRILS